LNLVILNKDGKKGLMDELKALDSEP